MWFGTIPGIAGLYKNSPTDTHPMTTMTVLWRKYNLGNLYFLDNWPAADWRQVVVNDPVRYRSPLASNHHWLLTSIFRPLLRKP